MSLCLGKRQEVFSILNQFSKRKGVALFGKLDCSVLDTTLFYGLGINKRRRKKCVETQNNDAQKDLYNNKLLTDSISLSYPACNSEISQNPG